MRCKSFFVQRFRIGKNRAAFACRYIFIYLKGKNRDIAKRTCFSAKQRSAVGLGAVFQKKNPFRFADPCYFFNLAHYASHGDQHCCFCPRCYFAFQICRVHVKRIIHIDHNRYCARAHHRTDGLNPEITGHQYFIARANTHGCHSALQGSSSVRHHKAVFHPDVAGKFLFELFSFALKIDPVKPEGRLGLHHPCNGIDFLLSEIMRARPFLREFQ